MNKSVSSFLFVWMGLVAALFRSASASASVVEQEHRHLGGVDLPYDPAVDVCKLGEDEATGDDIYGPCEESAMFQQRSNCDTKKQFVCYNRINRRDIFHRGDRQPKYFIDPRRVLCYENGWLNDGGCSTCSPGRYCLSEARCVLDEINYPCDQWL